MRYFRAKGFVFLSATLLLMLIFALQSHSQSFIFPVGFKDLQLGQSNKEVFKFLNSKQISSQNVYEEKKFVEVNPYFLYRDFYNLRFYENAIVFYYQPIQGQQNATYEVTIKDFPIENPDFTFWWDSFLKTFLLSYSNDHYYEIQKQSDLAKLSPYLRKLSFSAYQKKIYDINYNLEFTLDELVRYLNNHVLKYGEAASISTETNTITWIYSGNSVQITVPDHVIPIFRLRTPSKDINTWQQTLEIDKYRIYSEKYNKLIAQIHYDNIDASKKVSLYKDNVRLLLIQTLKTEADRRINTLEREMRRMEAEQIKKRSQGPSSDVDNL